MELLNTNVRVRHNGQEYRRIAVRTDNGFRRKWLVYSPRTGNFRNMGGIGGPSLEDLDEAYNEMLPKKS